MSCQKSPSPLSLQPPAQVRRRLLLGGSLVTLLAAFFLFHPPEPLRLLDLQIYDLLLAQSPPKAAGQLPVVVGIDEASLAEFGQWPWPRYRLAQLVLALQRQGVAAIGLDILLPEADRGSPEVLFAERQRDLGEKFPNQGWLAQVRSNDAMLAETLAAAPVVLACQFLYNSQAVAADKDLLHPLEKMIVAREVDAAPGWPEPRGVLAPLESLQAATAAIGFTNARPDPDGALRRLPLLLTYRQEYYPSLALATLMLATGEWELSLELLDQEARLSWFDRQLPLDARGQLLLGFSSQPRHRYVSAADLLLGRLPENALLGATVFVGAWSTGQGDRHLTPLAQEVPGVALHALAAATILHADWYHHPAWARGMELLAVVCLGLGSTFLLSRSGLLSALLLSIGGVLLIGWGSLLLLEKMNLFVAPTLPVLVLLCNGAFLGLLRLCIEANGVRQRSIQSVRS